MNELAVKQQELHDQEIVLSTFSKEAFYLVNKKSIRIIGILPTIFLTDLISKHKYFLNKNTLDSDGFFFSEQIYIEEETGVSKYEQRKAVTILEDLGVLETKRTGIPQRIWYRINYSTIITKILKISLIEIKDFIYNNKNKIEESTKVLSKDFSNPNPSLDSSKKTTYEINSSKTKEQPIIECPLPFLLKEWRTFPQVPKSQHHPKQNSKQHKRVNMLTTLLMKGQFGNHCVIDPKFLSDNKIEQSVLSHKFTEIQLSDGIYEMAKMFMEGNHPEDKTSISKRSFSELIYCPRTRISYLLKYLYKDAAPLEHNTVSAYMHWIDELYDRGLFDEDIENDNHQFGILKKGLVGIEGYYAWMVSEPMKEASYSLISTEDKFFNTYVDWLNDKNVCFNEPYKVGPQSNSWFKFIKWLEEAIHGDHVGRYPTLDRRQYGK